jgi:uracil-DNA glycosylase
MSIIVPLDKDLDWFCDQSWWNFSLAQQKNKPYFQSLVLYFKKARESKKEIYPPVSRIFRWSILCPFPKVKAVILGQDPYHRKGQADGLAFSVDNSYPKIPPTLQVIFKELKASIPEFMTPKHGSLARWASQGVLLLNSIMSIEAGVKKNCKEVEAWWNALTDEIVQVVARESELPVVFMLWGKVAQRKKELIEGCSASKSKNLVICTQHPSPILPNGRFVGSGCFVKANEFLGAERAINWNDL